MRSDLDALMMQRGLDALIVVAGEHYSAPLDYITNGVPMGSGFVVKVAGSAPFIVANPMEAEDATASGLEVLSWNALGFADAYAAAGHDRNRAMIELWSRALERAGLKSGTVGFYGIDEMNKAFIWHELIKSELPQYTFKGELSPTVFDDAYATKDGGELTRIISVAERTNDVVIATREFISGHRAGVGADGREIVIKADGTPLTIGDVKRFVRVQLIERGLEEAHMIFAQGREAGFPHSRGTDSEALRLGESIVFDLFPREIGGGYYHDITRTWAVGYASDALLDAYQQVMNAYDIAVESFGVGKLVNTPQIAVQDYFEDKGHPTLRSQPDTEIGYPHSLGHGIGLSVHEEPIMRHTSDKQTFQRGNVLTFEPGLYYPDEGFGVRIEDTAFVDQDGSLISISHAPKDLIVPLRG